MTEWFVRKNNKHGYTTDIPKKKKSDSKIEIKSTKVGEKRETNNGRYIFTTSGASGNSTRVGGSGASGRSGSKGKRKDRPNSKKNKHIRAKTDRQRIKHG